MVGGLHKFMNKIFVIYHKDSNIYHSDCFIPIQTGCFQNKKILNMLYDDNGDNISIKNPNYGELTAWYWVWKNYLPLHKDLEYIGFCHYRRFLDFFNDISSNNNVNSMYYDDFNKYFTENYNNKQIYSVIKNYDVIVPQVNDFSSTNMNIYEQYINFHPKEEMDKLIEILKINYPDYIQDMELVLSSNKGHFYLNYIMKKELFEDFMTWAFDLLSKMDIETNWQIYTDYNSIRTPAYLMERFFNIWLVHKIRVENIKVLEKTLIMLVDGRRVQILPGISISVEQKNKVIINIFGIKISFKL